MPRFVAVLFVAALVVGCAGRPGPDALDISETAAPGTHDHTVLVASTRARDPQPGVFYNGDRSEALSFARFDISVPPTHKAGEVEWPRKSPPNPATDMVVREAAYRQTPQEFDADLAAELAKLPPGQRRVIIFIHGYNTLFSEALYRITQVAEDSHQPGIPVLFTWASRGETVDYVYDNNSATAARDGLEQTIRRVFASGAEQVNILAHSMGNWVTVEALRQIRISGELIPTQKLGNVILAAPDIDVDVFKTQLKRFGKLPKPFIVIVSGDDKALSFSQFIAGGKGRLGSYTNDAELVELGAVVIDMTKVKGIDDFNHGKFAQLVAMAPEMQKLVLAAREGKGPEVVDVNGVRVVGLAQFGRGLSPLDKPRLPGLPPGKPQPATPPPATPDEVAAPAADPRAQ
ncbi:alpha/beta hydrolase [Ancylobacter lacus]|uniref:alpha/beta hydrolase n=1 Tax=Ancylobacter lacus TaxID=2579970 RepID=UPI001BCBCBFE|nr:alpha/beta hydrolase [Ancylobacter lacus]MBS7540748.1 alpha/beta hydrolase [Ancylobacter lacus]